MSDLLNTTATSYRVFAFGEQVGMFSSESADDALEAYAKEAGYDTFDELIEATGADRGDFKTWDRTHTIFDSADPLGLRAVPRVHTDGEFATWRDPATLEYVVARRRWVDDETNQDEWDDDVNRGGWVNDPIETHPNGTAALARMHALAAREAAYRDGDMALYDHLTSSAT